MIVVDTSALMAIAQHEPLGESCVAALGNAAQVLISAATLTEFLIVASGRNIRQEADALFEAFSFDIVDVTSASARRAAAAYTRWGKGFHQAALNFGDCFAYELAMHRDCPLLYVGDDFARTDVRSAL